MIAWNFKNRSLRPIGLDIGHNSIKMIQLAVAAGHTSVVAVHKVRLEDGLDEEGEAKSKFVISAIKQMLGKGDFRGRSVVSCLSNDKLEVTSLRLAETETDRIEEALRKEVTRRFGMDPDTDALNYVLAGNVRHGDETKSEFILFAADSQTIRKHIEMLEAAGLKPVGIDTVPCALFRSFERSLRRQEDKERTAVFVDVGRRFTTVVFGRGGEISFVKQILIGGEKFDLEIAAKLGVSISEAEILRGKLRAEKQTNGAGNLCAADPSSMADAPTVHAQQLDTSTRQVMVDAIDLVAEELAREISLCFRYYTVTFRGKRVERAVISGGEAYEEILLNVIRRRLSVEIEVAQPLRGFDMTRVHLEGQGNEPFCEWAVAVGLSLKGWRGATSEAYTYEGN
jgi:type IV pilus assembly protein PilM